MTGCVQSMHGALPETFIPGGVDIIGFGAWKQTQQLNALMTYKKLAEEKGMHGNEPECTADILGSLVKRYFPHVAVAPRGILGHDSNFEWLGTRYVVEVQRGNITSYAGPSEYSSFGEPFLL